MQPEPAPSRLVVDANVFFRRTVKQIKDSLEVTSDVCSTPDVIRELKDEKTREYFHSQLPFEVLTQAPSTSALKRVQNFAKKTGDFVSLSGTDMGLIALAVDYIIERGQGTSLKAEPKKLKEAKPISFKKHYREFEDSEEEEEQDEEDSWNYVGKSSEKEEQKAEEQPHQPEDVAQEKEEQDREKEEQGEQEEEDSCEDEWITAENIAEQLELEKSETGVSQTLSGVILATADFAMQNVALQMGIRVVSSDTGLRIRTLRSYCLICKSCAKVQSDKSRQFCSECGNHNLRKASLYIHENGEVTYFMNPLRGYNKRGTVFSLPMPKGGRKNQDIVLCEDQLLYGVRARLREEQRRKQEKEAKKQQHDMDGYLTGQAGQFVAGSKGAHLDNSKIRLEYGVGCKNPNSKTKPRYAKKKKNH